MGYYDTRELPIYRYLHAPGHPHYAIADNFFQAAFGGSFLNHQWLIAARDADLPGALADRQRDDQHSVVGPNGLPSDYPLYTADADAREGHGADPDLPSTPAQPRPAADPAPDACAATTR